MSAEKIAVMVIVTSAVAPPAFAQVTRQFDLGVSASVLHDTNVARAGEELATLRGLSREDTIFTPAVTASVVMPFGRQALFANGLVGYDFYQKNDQLNRERYVLNAGVNGRFGMCQPSLTGSYSRAQSDLRDLGLLDPENTVESKSVELGVSCVREPGPGVSLSMRRTWAENSNEIQRQADYEATAYTASISYGRPALGKLRVFTEYQETEYPNRGFFPGLSGGYNSWNTGFGFERRIGARIQGDVSVSYNSVEMDGGFVGSGGDFDGVAYSANLDYRASSRLAFRGQFSKQIAPSVRIGDAYTVQEQWALRGTYELGSRLALEFGGDSMDERYEGLLPIAGPGLAVKDSRINTVYGALTYKPTDRLTLRLNIERQERDADNDLFDYTSDRIGLKADFGLF